MEGTYFVVITDNSSLKWLNSLKNPSGRLTRWALKIQDYDYEIVHHKGVLHVAPDTLPRIACTVLRITEDDVEEEYRALVARLEADPGDLYLYKLVEGLLYRRCKLVNPASRREDPLKVFGPRPLRAQVLSQNHDVPTAGHFGIFKTYKRVAARYDWPRMLAEVAKYVKTCEVCQAHKVEQKVPDGQLGYRKDPTDGDRPCQYLSKDLQGPFPL